MPKVSLEELRTQLRNRQFAPVYLLYGPETFLRDSAVGYLSKQAFTDSDLVDFNDNSFSLSDPESIRSALAAADQLPMMSERRVVRITDVRVSSTSARDTLKEEYLDLLNSYLERPSPHSIVVFIADEINGNRKISRALEKYASVVEFAELAGDALLDWISKEFDRQGASVDHRTAQYLASVCGAGLQRLSNEISKLAVAALPAGKVTPDLIDGLISNTREIDNFALTDHLVAGRGKQALSVTKKILDDGGEPLMLLGLMSYNYRRLLMVKDMMDEGRDRAQIVRDLRLFRDQEKYMTAARRTSRKRLMSAISQLASTDLAIKTSVGGSTGGGRIQLEMLICDLAASGRQ